MALDIQLSMEMKIAFSDVNYMFENEEDLQDYLTYNLPLFFLTPIFPYSKLREKKWHAVEITSILFNNTEFLKSMPMELMNNVLGFCEYTSNFNNSDISKMRVEYIRSLM